MRVFMIAFCTMLVGVSGCHTDTAVWQRVVVSIAGNNFELTLPTDAFVTVSDEVISAPTTLSPGSWRVAISLSPTDPDASIDSIIPPLWTISDGIKLAFPGAPNPYVPQCGPTTIELPSIWSATLRKIVHRRTFLGLPGVKDTFCWKHSASLVQLTLKRPIVESDAGDDRDLLRFLDGLKGHP